METYGTVYGLKCHCAMCDPGEIRYVGQSKHEVKKRYNKHLANADAGEQTPVYKWIRKHGTQHISYQVLEDGIPLSDLDRSERDWIEKLSTFLGTSDRGLNMTKGGQSQELDMDELEVRRQVQGPGRHKKRLTWDAVQDMRRRYAETEDSVGDIARDYGVVEGTVYSVVMNHNWYDPEYVYTRRSKKGKVNIGEDAPGAKLTWDKVGRIRKAYLAGEEQEAISKEYEVALGTINRIVRNRMWKDPEYTPPAPRSVTKASQARNCRLTQDEADSIRESYRAGGVLQKELARKYGVSISTIRGVIQGKTYTRGGEQ